MDAWAAGAVIGLLAAYAYLAGGGSSVIRATVMASIYLALRAIDQRTAPLHAMSITLVAVLIASPLSIADVGLWLTFGATAAIVAGAAIVRLPQSVWFRAPAALLLASLAAEAVLIPIVAFVFQRVTVAGLAVNLAAIPCMAVVQIATMVTAAADALDGESLAGFAGWVTHAGVWGLIESARLVDLAPWLTWRVPSPAGAVILACCIPGGRRHVEALGEACRAGRGVVDLDRRCTADVRARARRQPAASHGHRRRPGRRHARHVPERADAGGRHGRRHAARRVRHRRPCDRPGASPARAPAIGLPGGDARRSRSHWRRTRARPRLRAGRDLVGRPRRAPRAIERSCDGRSDRARATWRTLQRGDRFDIGGVELRVHHPPPPDWERQKVRNNDSLVIELRFGQVSVLLTGDIGREVEQELLATLDLLPTVVLKVPHHGSGTSSSVEFVQKLKPAAAVIGVGRSNLYGHPVPYVLERYHAAGTEIFRTDRDGQVEVITDGVTLTTRTFTGRAWEFKR